MAAGYPAEESAQPAAAVEVKAVAVELPSLETRIQWYEDWEEATRKENRLARRDRAYYDHEQWTEAERKVLRGRKQPVLTKNRIKRKIDFVLGEVIKKRTDPTVFPRTPQHEDDARVMTDALRFVEEEQGTDQVQLAVAKNMAIEGFGGALKSFDEDGEDIKHELTHIEWDRLFYDPKSRAPDFSDAKYLGIVLWRDLDDAVLDYPDAADALEAAIRDTGYEGSDQTEDTPRGWIDSKRKRVKICELYFRVGDNWYRSDFTKAADLYEPQETGYLDDSGKRHLCPLIMQSCYVDANGFRYGIVRGMISPQDEVNKRSSKSLHILNSKQVIAERDAILDPQEFQSQLAKPDGVALVEPGRLLDGTVQIQNNNDLVMGHVQMLQEAKQEIDEVGPSSATLPSLPESASGRAFIARQQSASQELGLYFDGIRDWTHRVYKLDWPCIRWNWTEEKWLRVRDDQELAGYRFVAINRRMTRAQRLQELLQKSPAPPFPAALNIAAGTFAPLVMTELQQQHQAMAAQQPQLQQLQGPDLEQHMAQMAAQHPLMQEEITTNQVAQMGGDIIVDEAPETSVIEQEEFGKLSEVAGTIIQVKPDMAPQVGKMLLKASQLRNKRELLEEWDKGPSPEQQQQQQMAQQMQMQQMQLQIQLAQTQLELTRAQTQLTLAKAQSEQARMTSDMADAQHTQAETQLLMPTEAEKNQAQAMKAAAEAGEKAAGAAVPGGVL